MSRKIPPAPGPSRSSRGKPARGKASAKAAKQADKERLKGAVEEAKESARRQADAAKREAKASRGSVLDRAAAKVDDKLSEHLARQEEAAARSARQAAKLERVAGLLGAFDIWTRAEPGERRPRFSRDEIAAAAIRIADEEGLEALSMRHLAAELGAGTMTLYHYVRTKDELMMLVSDAIMAEVVVPDDQPLPSDWRAAISVIARRTRAALERHPWVFDITDDPPFGPNGVRHFDQSLQAVASLDAPLGDRLDVVSCVDEFVFGHCLQQRNNAGDDGRLTDELRGYVGDLVATGDYPHIQELADTLGFDRAWDEISAHLRDPERFERNLARLLDGIEASFATDEARRQP